MASKKKSTKKRTPAEKPPVKHCWLPASAFFELRHACEALSMTYGRSIYLVGSCLERRDYRDVDVRYILDDELFDRLFPGYKTVRQLDAVWSIHSTAISLWLSHHSGLPVDFQYQSMTEANTRYPGKREPLAMLHRSYSDD